MFTLAGIDGIITERNIWILIPLVAMMIPITAVIIEGFRKAISAHQYEQSRREISAYIAEGSITPEEGERLLRARPDTKKERRQDQS